MRKFSFANAALLACLLLAFIFYVQPQSTDVKASKELVSVEVINDINLAEAGLSTDLNNHDFLLNNKHYTLGHPITPLLSAGWTFCQEDSEKLLHPGEATDALVLTNAEYVTELYVRLANYAEDILSIEECTLTMIGCYFYPDQKNTSLILPRGATWTLKKQQVLDIYGDATSFSYLPSRTRAVCAYTKESVSLRLLIDKDLGVVQIKYSLI